MKATERPISAVLYEMVGQVEEIVRSEIHLAKTEVREELKKARPATVLTALAPMGVPKTVASVKENVEWAKQQTR